MQRPEARVPQQGKSNVMRQDSIRTSLQQLTKVYEAQRHDKLQKHIFAPRLCSFDLAKRLIPLGCQSLTLKGHYLFHPGT